MKQAALIAIVILFLLPAEAFAVSDHIEYNISVGNDNSASWTIIKVTDIDSPVDSWEEFEQRLVSAVEVSGERTNREMALDFTSLVMNTEVHWETSSKTVTYTFRWLNFSLTEQGKISFGDVLSENFFTSLYGDGELYLTYPVGYRVTSAAFSPDERDDSNQLLHWYRTQDFLVENQNISIELEGNGTSSESNVNFTLFAVVGLSVGAVGAMATGFLLFKQRRRQMDMRQKLGAPWHDTESDEEKVLQLLQSSGGSLKQSDVCDRLRFSRAKTSLLLAEMEKNSLVLRTKKGKNKIIFSVEKKEGRNL